VIGETNRHPAVAKKHVLKLSRRSSSGGKAHELSFSLERVHKTLHQQPRERRSEL
jgi:hypothetical protein